MNNYFNIKSLLNFFDGLLLMAHARKIGKNISKEENFIANQIETQTPASFTIHIKNSMSPSYLKQVKQLNWE